ncbi:MULTISPECIES: hypothetical protein [unclassified Streptomyces]|uniref:hypothetical protein n=1 Tax=unclassified Streptomyces TaxID=2593676 RepID=UPI0023EC1968|nr:hypothetical protein [Streptomyces sp. WMMB303]MDF4251204.1 hypothetical protein [Streptomyces sp. WMMB303]
MSVDPQPSDRPGTPREAAASLVFDDPLTRPSADDTDRGWGEGGGPAGASGDLARFLDEKPPHHL